jgi:uncharacterized membrane protein YfcA
MKFLSFAALCLLIAVVFAVCVVGVVTGSQSLVTVPLMFQFGIDSRVAVATNMFGLAFMSAGSAIPFVGKKVFDRRRMPLFIILTVFGSTLGALLVGLISSRLMPLVVSISMFAVVAFSFFYKKPEQAKKPTMKTEFLVYFLTFTLGIYGGLYSGGYTTILTAIYLGFAGMTITEAVANTKLINLFSSLVAATVFAAQGLIDYKLGVALAVTMFAAGFIGAKIAVKLNEVWLKRIFLATVLILASKIIYDAF